MMGDVYYIYWLQQSQAVHYLDYLDYLEVKSEFITRFAFKSNYRFYLLDVNMLYDVNV